MMPNTVRSAVDLGRIRDRMVEMRDIADGALAELDLAAFHAHRCGMSVEEIARHAQVEEAEIRRTIAVIDRDQDIVDLDHYNDSATWIRYYRKSL